MMANILDDIFKYTVIVNHKNISDSILKPELAQKWCQKHGIGIFRYQRLSAAVGFPVKWFFAKAEDAVAFKLVWAPEGDRNEKLGL